MGWEVERESGKEIGRESKINGKNRMRSKKVK